LLKVKRFVFKTWNTALRKRWGKPEILLTRRSISIKCNREIEDMSRNAGAGYVYTWIKQEQRRRQALQARERKRKLKKLLRKRKDERKEKYSLEKKRETEMRAHFKKS